MAKATGLNSAQISELLTFFGELASRGQTRFKIFNDEVLSGLDQRIAAVAKSVGEEGIDPFGMNPQAIRKVAVGAAFLYRLYFRCQTKGLDNIPEGPVILVANHAGQLPFDGLMITTAMLLEGEPPRLARSLVDRWAASLPFVSTLYSRLGVAVGAPENAERLLKRNEALLTFPEGVAGISKTIDRAYQLEEFSLGFVRLSMSMGAPIVPIAVLGSEEQYPTLYNIKSLAKLLGIPAVPIWLHIVLPGLGLMPLPVRYQIRFGAPMRFTGDPDDRDEVIGEKAEEVRAQIQTMLDVLRQDRKGIFF